MGKFVNDKSRPSGIPWREPDYQIGYTKVWFKEEIVCDETHMGYLRDWENAINWRVRGCNIHFPLPDEVYQKWKNWCAESALLGVDDDKS